MPDQHSLLSPSAAKRWMTCAPSALLEAELPDSTSDYAREGTLAHAVAEHLLRFYLQSGLVAPWDDVAAHLEELAIADGAFVSLAARAAELGADFREMLETVHDKYVAIVWEDFVRARSEDPLSVLLVETRVDLSDWIPEGFGTTDASIISGHTLTVYDLKYGRGVRVSAKGNPQMRCYAAGMLAGEALVYEISSVRMVIVQPRLGAVSEDRMSAYDLAAWADDELAPAAGRAYRGEGDYVPGQHCEFCRAKARCKALATYCQRVADINPDARLMAPDELAAVLPAVGVIELWVSAVKAEAVRRLSEGLVLPGWKLVEGRSVRRISDADKAAQVLEQAGFTRDDYLKQELKGITDLERLVGKKNFGPLLGHLVERKSGSPVLAPASDPRAPFSPAASAEADFGGQL